MLVFVPSCAEHKMGNFTEDEVYLPFYTCLFFIILIDEAKIEGIQFFLAKEFKFA